MKRDGYRKTPCQWLSGRIEHAAHIMSPFPRKIFCGEYLDRRLVLALLTVVVALIVAGCQSQPAPGPSAVEAETPRGFTLFATDTPSPTPTSTPTATPTATPTSTPTSTPTATPEAASAAGSAPVGRVVFGVVRAGEAAEQLWLQDNAGGLTLLADAVSPGGWICSATPPGTCALLTADGTLLAGNPISQTTTLLDQVNLTGVLSPTITGANGPLALSADGAALAAVLPDRVDLYDLAAPALDASIVVTGVTELAWSPDGEMLALVYPVGGADALALWSRGNGRLRVVAQMESVQHAVWSPDSDKIAFDAFQPPATRPSQADRKDVFVLFLRSGEIANFSEVALRNNGVAAANRVAAWSPRWQSADVLRYVRGVPDSPETHAVMAHPVRSRKATRIWFVDDEGMLGILSSPDGEFDARAVVVDDHVAVQTRASGTNEWTNLPGTFDHLNGLAWSPVGGDKDAPRYLLLVQEQNLLAVETGNDAIQGLARVCQDCKITRAVWLP